MSGDDKIKSSDFFKGTTRRIDNADEATRRLGDSDSNDKTIERMSTADPTTPMADSDQTRLYRPVSRGGSDTMKGGDQPFVVGWLVIVKGPGRGAGIPIGFGRNTVGRGANQRITLNFGDDEISRENHCSIIFDDKNERFFLNHGDSQNLTYLNDQPVLAPSELADGAMITIGDTQMLFKALCGGSFSWSSFIDSETAK